MSEPDPGGLPHNQPLTDRLSEGGLRAPPEYGRLRKLWWWFDFLILVKLARLRFVAVLVIVGLLIVYWDTLAAYYELLKLAEGRSVSLEEYAREMILLEELHLDEVNKMLRKPGEIAPFSE